MKNSDSQIVFLTSWKLINFRVFFMFFLPAYGFSCRNHDSMTKIIKITDFFSIIANCVYLTSMYFLMIFYSSKNIFLHISFFRIFFWHRLLSENWRFFDTLRGVKSSKFTEIHQKSRKIVDFSKNRNLVWPLLLGPSGILWVYRTF